MKIDALNLSTMHSGNLCLELSECIDWDAFPAYIADILKRTSGKIIDKNDAPDMRIWKIEIDAQEVRAVYEDYPQMVSIESNSSGANTVIKKLFGRFKTELGS